MFINEGTINASGGGGQPGQQVKIRKLYGASIGVNGNPGEPAIGGGAGGGWFQFRFRILWSKQQRG